MFESASTTLMSSAAWDSMRWARCSMTSARLSEPKMELNLLTDANDQQRKEERKGKIRSCVRMK